MFVRFVIHELDRDSGRRRGIFQAVADLVKSNTMEADELRQLLALRAWFNDHLDKPDRFARGQKKHAAHRAIGWFKASAGQHVSRIQEMCRILNAHGIATEMITEARPGYIVYEDDYQIAAVPFSETRT